MRRRGVGGAWNKPRPKKGLDLAATSRARAAAGAVLVEVEEEEVCVVARALGAASSARRVCAVVRAAHVHEARDLEARVLAREKARKQPHRRFIWAMSVERYNCTCQSKYSNAKRIRTETAYGIFADNSVRWHLATNSFHQHVRLHIKISPHTLFSKKNRPSTRICVAVMSLLIA